MPVDVEDKFCISMMLWLCLLLLTRHLPGILVKIMLLPVQPSKMTV